MGTDGANEGNPFSQERPVSPPVLIGQETIKRLNGEGVRYKWEPLRIVDEAREAMIRMRDGKNGIVIGSGPNTQVWKERGWKTLDVNAAFNPDINIDANHLESAVAPGTVDYILTECVTMDEGGVNGVGWGRLLNQANKALKPDGSLVIITAAFEGNPNSTLPPRDWYAQRMSEHGFNAIVEVDTIQRYGEDKSAQKVIYYGNKVGEGYDESRSQSTHVPSFDQDSGKPIR